VVWHQSANGRFPIDRRADGQQNLHADLQRQRRERRTIRDGVGNLPCSHCDPHGKSGHGQEWRNRSTNLVSDQCHRLHCLGRLERPGSDRGFANDAGSDGNHKIYPDLHGCRRLGIAIGHGQRVGAPRAHGVPERESYKREQRWRLNPDLDLDQCHRLHCLGRMERRSSNQRIEVHRRPKRDRGVYIELYGHGRHDRTKRDRYCDREQQWNSNAGLGATHAKY
jgi:hypothetical protein